MKIVLCLLLVWLKITEAEPKPEIEPDAPKIQTRIVLRRKH